jgi:carbon-monoxide dehydrogenase medium subunit
MRYEKPATLQAAVAALSASGRRALAGGTDLLVRLGRESPWPAGIVDLKGLPELRGIDQDEQGLRIGAGVCLAELAAAPQLVDYPALAEACRVFGARQIRARATLGGNLANASPAADSVPPLVVYEAHCSTDRRGMPVEQLATGPGETVLAADEIITEIVLPPPAAGARSFFYRLATRDALAIAIVSVAGLLELEGRRVRRARIAVGAAAPTVFRAFDAEDELAGASLDTDVIARAAAAAAAAAQPIDDVRATARYRRLMVERLLAHELMHLH